MIPSLHIVQPPTHTQESLTGREMVLSFRHIYEANAVQELKAIRFTFQLPIKFNQQIESEDRFRNSLRLEFTYCLPALRYVSIIGACGRFGEDAQLPLKMVYEFLDALSTYSCFL